MPALNRILVSTQSTRFGMASLDAVERILAADRSVVPLETSSRETRPTEPAALSLRFEGFTLKNGRRVLDGRTVEIAPGELCVVWGPSGSGKSTIVEALVDGAPGLELRYGGARLEGGLAALPGRVGVTVQSPLVLPGTLRENLALGLPSPGDLDVAAFAELLDRDPASILDGPTIAEHLDAAIHRHAVSGGQAQRISLIRALAAHHEIVVLDEPTSALDPRVAEALRRRIDEERSGRIFVVVSHDPEMKRMADVLVEVS
jgi:ABC-type multidrug transport system fused ATPase/permease subunit